MGVPTRGRPLLLISKGTTHQKVCQRADELTCPRGLLDYIANLVDKRIGRPTDDLISKLVTEQVKPGHIEKSDAVQIAFLLLVAGNATMVNMIALVGSTIPSRQQPL